MDLTDEELLEIHNTIYDKVYYGDDYIVYGEGPQALRLRSSLRKLDDEIKRRGL